MAQVDAQIPLMVNNPQELQQQAYRNQLAQLQLQQGQQEQQQNNALLGILKQPGSVGDNGLPTPATVQRIMQVNPEAGFKIQNQLATIEENRQRAIGNAINQRLLGLNIADKQHDTLVDIATSAQQRYEDLVSSGTPKDEAARIVGQERNKSISDAQESGMLTSDQSRVLQSPFNPDINKAFVTGSAQYKRVLDEQRQARQEQTGERRADLADKREERMARTEEEKANRPESDIGKLSYDLQRGKITQKDYDAAVLNKTKGFNPEDVDSVVDQMGKYDMPPLTGQALRTPWGQAVMAGLAKKYPDYDAKEYKTRQAAIGQFEYGKKGDTVRSLSVSLDHLDTLSEAGKALKNGNIQSFNKLAQTLAEQTGSAVPTNFEAAKSIVADEVVKGILGSGGGVGDREKAQAIFDKVKSPDQLAGAVTQVQKLLRGQLNGLERQYKESTGRDDFDRFLSPSARKLEGSGSAPKKIASKAEFDALPSGTEFIAPDGSRRRKP
nr:hypothetical protein HUO10_003333 [Paraburkholderia busanensis]